MDEVIQPLTSEEKRREQMVDVWYTDPKKKLEFHKAVEKKMAEKTKVGKPFCGGCAVRDYQKALKMHESQTEEAIQMGREPPAMRKYEPDWEDYTNRMEYKSESFQPIPIRRQGVTLDSVQIKFENWKCNKCSGGISIEITKDIEQQRKKK